MIKLGYVFYNPNPSGKFVGDCVIRAICKILNKSWEQEDDYLSNNSYSNGGYSQRRMPIYYNSDSYRNGTRMMNNNYSRRGRGYSYDDSKHHMIEKLNNLMMEANDQHDKEAIQRLIDQMAN